MKLNVNSIKRRLRKLEQYIAELEKQRTVTLTMLKSDLTRQLAVERAFQAAIESCTDIAAHMFPFTDWVILRKAATYIVSWFRPATSTSLLARR